MIRLSRAQVRMYLVKINVVNTLPTSDNKY